MANLGKVWVIEHCPLWHHEQDLFHQELSQTLYVKKGSLHTFFLEWISNFKCRKTVTIQIAWVRLILRHCIVASCTCCTLTQRPLSPWSPFTAVWCLSTALLEYLRAMAGSHRTVTLRAGRLQDWHQNKPAEGALALLHWIPLCKD